VHPARQAAAIAEACEALAGTATAAREAPAAQTGRAAAEDLEARYAALPAEVQEELRTQATAHLLQRGTPLAFCIKPVVLAEVCRLLAGHDGNGGASATSPALHAAEAVLEGGGSCKNVAVDDRHAHKNVAVALKELDPEPLQELQDPEPTPHGPTEVCHAQKSKATLRDVQAEDLRDLERILALHHQAAMRGWVSWSEADRLNVVAAAVHARRVGQDPCRLFVALLRDRRWEVITQEDEDTAHRWLRAALYGPAPRKEPEATAPPPVPAVPLSEDARFVDAVQRVLPPAWRGQPFLAVKLQDTTWTRARWERAQAELTQWRLLQAQANARSDWARLGTISEDDGALEDTANEDAEG